MNVYLFPDFSPELRILHLTKRILGDPGVTHFYLKVYPERDRKIQLAFYRLLRVIIEERKTKSRRLVKLLVSKVEDPFLLEQLIHCVEDVVSHRALIYARDPTMFAVVRYLKLKVRKNCATRRTSLHILQGMKYLEKAKTLQNYLSN